MTWEKKVKSGSMRLFFCSVLLLMTVASGKRLEADTESVTAGAAPPSSGKGDGVYLQKPFSSSLSREAQANNITNPYVDGTAASFSWSELEPTEGDFQWRIVEETIQPWAAAGKKVILGVHTGTVGTIGRKVKQATPEWVFSSGARKMKVPDGTILPIYWDPIYFEKYRNFVKAFAKKYDGDPRIEFIRIGVGVWGELVVERWFPRPENAEMRERWKKAGYDPERWIQTIEKTMEMYREAFQKTPCAIQVMR
ncbi:MAG: beta-galactosidase [Candidatus Manganitrophaceae bacterium]